MEIIKTEIKGVYIIENKAFSDERGKFVKFFNESVFKSKGLCVDFKESYFSVSAKDVIRGMHFQLPPHDHEKLVFVPYGEIVDVILDLRKDSQTYGQHISVELSADNNRAIYIPRGLAHGFKSMQDGTITVYNVATEYAPESDAGISWDSFGFDWVIDNPIISERDKKFVNLSKFSSPFIN